MIKSIMINNYICYLNKLTKFLWIISIIILFLLLLIVPTKYDKIVFILILFCLFFSLINILITGNLNLHKEIILWLFFLISIGSFFTTYGIFRNNIGALSNGKVYILYPLIYCIILSRFNSLKLIKLLHKILLISDFIICFYIISFILNYIKILPDKFFINLNLGQSIGIYKYYMEFNLYSLSSLIFLIPYNFALLIQDKNEIIGIKKIIIYVLFTFSVSLSFLSGRRILIFLIFITPILLVIFFNYFPTEEKNILLSKLKKIVIYFLLVVFFALFLLIIFNFNIKIFIENLFNAFNPKKDISANLRYTQFYALINDWLKRPILGYGFGATLKYLVRSETMPWAFELTYISLLHQTGIVGLILYLISIGWIYYRAIIIFKSNSIYSYHLLPILVGTTSFLIANSTNPYLAKFSYLWVIFLPIILINLSLLEEKNERNFSDN